MGLKEYLKNRRRIEILRTIEIREEQDQRWNYIIQEFKLEENRDKIIKILEKEWFQNKINTPNIIK